MLPCAQARKTHSLADRTNPAFERSERSGTLGREPTKNISSQSMQGINFKEAAIAVAIFVFMTDEIAS